MAQTYKLAKTAIDLVVNKYGAQLNPKFMSLERFQAKKGGDRACKIDKEREKNKTAKVYPAKDEELFIVGQYSVDTFIIESLYYLLRDQFFYCQYPNALSIATLKIQSHLVRFDLYGGISEEFIRANEINKPY